jgi:hypothetical protein
MLNIHITHHAGTHLCHVLGYNGDPNGPRGSPAFACMSDKSNLMNGTFPGDYPWSQDTVSSNIQSVRPFFHFISWEFSYPNRNPLEPVDWEDPHLVSIVAVKHPVDRFLSFIKDGRCAQELGYQDMFAETHKAGNYSALNHTDWWRCARGEVDHPKVIPTVADNYGLRILADGGCCQGADTDRKHLEYAKTLVDRMTVVLDVECLNDGITALANLTGIALDLVGNKQLATKMQSTKHVHASARERIGHDDVYEYLLEKNQLEIEFYEWAKTKSLVQCNVP